jgi:Ca2+/Na+ antiporter
MKPVILSNNIRIAIQNIAIYNCIVGSLNNFLKGISTIIIIANKITNANNLNVLIYIYLYVPIIIHIKK